MTANTPRTSIGARLSARRALWVVLLVAALAPATALADGAPTASLTAPANVGTGSATLTGVVDANGADTGYQFLWGQTGGYEGGAIPLVPASVGSAVGDVPVSADLGGLTPSTTYHYALVATSAAGSVTTADGTLTTATPPAPTATIAVPSQVGLVAATLAGVVDPQGFDTTYQFAWGTTAAYEGGRVPAAPAVAGAAAGPALATAELTGLIPGTTYHAALVATSLGGTTTSDDIAFTTPIVAPAVTVAPPGDLGPIAATLIGTVDAQGSATSYQFAWGSTTAYEGGLVPAAAVDVGAGATPMPVSAPLSGLVPGTTYHAALIATSAGGTSTSDDVSFTTPVPAPVVSVAAATDVGPAAASLSGTVDPEGSATTYQFAWGETAAYEGGLTAATATDVGTVSAPTTVSTELLGLPPDTTVHYALVATNAGGTSTSADATLKTSSGPCAPAGTRPRHPQTYRHVVWIWMENKGYRTVFGSPDAAYERSLRDRCGSSTGYVDNMFGALNLVSEGHYLAAVAGSNCVVGLGKNVGDSGGGRGRGCLWSDSAPYSSGCRSTAGCPNDNTLPTRSLFEQVAETGRSWTAWQEAMPRPCQYSSSGTYAAKHNPAIYFDRLTGANNPALVRSSCMASDLPFDPITCTVSRCTLASNDLTAAIDSGRLPAFSFVTPNLCNDTHGGSCPHGASVGVGDQWLQTYVQRIVAGPNYRAGDTAIFVMWDEASPNAAQPNIVVAPSIPAGGTVGAEMNHFAALRATESLLGLTERLGCAGGLEPGTVTPCPPGSTADVRSIFGF